MNQASLMKSSPCIPYALEKEIESLVHSGLCVEDLITILKIKYLME